MTSEHRILSALAAGIVSALIFIANDAAFLFSAASGSGNLV